MRALVKDFKGFALSGNVIDLAIGVILGVAFGAVVDSFANDILMNIVAAIFGQPDFSELSFTIGNGEIGYGMFLTALVNFLLIAFALLMVVKLLMRVGMNFRAQGNVECEYCKEFVPVDATRCKFCTSELIPVVPD